VSVTVTVNGQAGPSVVATTGDTVVANVAAATAISVSASAAAAPGGVGATGATGPAGPSYTLPTASATVLGGIKVGSGLTITGGVLSSSGGSGGSSVSLSDATPSALGTASAGSSSSASRADHVHAVPVISYTNLTNVPSTFTPATHQHAISDVTGLQTALDGKQSSGTYATLVSGLVPTANLPLATTSAAGAVIVGTGLAISSGVLSATGTGTAGDVDGGDYTGTLVYDRTITITQQPTDQSAVSGAATISVAATASPSGTLTYQWQKLQGSTWTNISGATSPSLVLSGLTNAANNGDRYRCVISAASAASVTSNESLLAVNPTVPGTPSGITAVRGDGSVTLSWAAPSNGGSAITDYVVQYVGGGSITWTTFADGTSAATTATLTGLATGYYQFRVAAVNAIGQGAYGTTDDSTYFGPQRLTVSANTMGATITGMGDTQSPLVVTCPQGTTGGQVDIKLANATTTQSVTWYVTVSSGTVRVADDFYNGSTTSTSYSGTSSLSPSGAISLFGIVAPFGFTFNAYR